MAAPALGQQQIARLLMAQHKPHGFVIPQLGRRGLVLRGSNLRNRDDRRNSGGIVGWRWNNGSQEADIPVREP